MNVLGPPVLPASRYVPIEPYAHLVAEHLHANACMGSIYPVLLCDFVHHPRLTEGVVRM